MDKRSRGYCFTVNTYDDDDIARVMSLYEEDDNCTYLICGFEKAPKTGREHLQCYIYFTNAISWSRANKILFPWHVEIQKSKTNVASYCYCMEEGNYYEMGVRPRQGHRTDLEVIKYDLLGGKPTKDIALQYFSQWCQYRRAFNEFVEQHRHYNTSVVFYRDHDIQCMDNIAKTYDPFKDYFWNNDDSVMDLMIKYRSKRYRYMYLGYKNTPEELKKYFVSIGCLTDAEIIDEEEEIEDI